MQTYETRFIELISEASSIEKEILAGLLRTPEAKQGDICLPCFTFAKTLRRNPAQIAAEWVEKMSSDPRFESIVAEGPYINARISGAHIVSQVVNDILDAGESFGNADLGNGQTIVIDYSSPNIAKPLGFHHLRSTMIGNALSRVHKALGYQVVGINFLGDWGKTFGLLAEGFRRFGDREALNEKGIAYLLELYVKSNAEAKANSEFDDAARAMFRKQEEQDPEAVELWKLFREISLREFERVYSRLDVSFDLIEGESHYRDGMDEVVAQIAKATGVREDQGALVVDMPYDEGEPPMMLKKSDGATLYATRDVAAAMDRWQRFSFEKCLYVVGGEQKRHFDQLKRALSAMGQPFADKMIHVHFGRIQGMSTRKGTVVYLDEVLDEARDRAMEKMKGRDLDLDTVSEQVGIGGIVFGDLKNLRTSDYEFNWEEILNPKGFTGICVQYAHARCSSMIRKGGGVPKRESVDLALLTAPEEVQLVKELSRLPGLMIQTADVLEPSKLARGIYEVAKAWNQYQQAGKVDSSLRVLVADPALKNARLVLVDAVRIGLKKGLSLLGISAPDAM